MNGALSTLPMGGLYGDMMDPRAMGMLQAGLGIMAASGPSMTPVSLGQALGKGGMQGLQGFQQAQQANQQQMLYRLKMAEFEREAADRKRKEEALAEFNKRFPHLAHMAVIDPKTAMDRAYPESKPPRTHADAQGVMRYLEGPNMGQVVPGFETPKAPEGFTYVNGTLTPIPEYWKQKEAVAAAGRPSTTIENYPNPVAVMGADGKPRMVQFGKKGDMRETPYQPYEEPKPPADVERTAAGYANRMMSAERIIQEVGPAGFSTHGTDAAARLPLVGSYAERSMMTPDQQKVQQAQRDWVRAKLRKESGAVIAKEEEDNEIATYFPRPGDSPEVIAQKAQARETAMQAMVQSAGRAAPKNEPRPKVVPKSKQFKLDDGKSVIGILEERTGKYYVMRGGQKFYIEE